MPVPSWKRLTQEQLIAAFNELMPKRPVYPPLVPSEVELNNSDTDSEGSDVEDDESPKKSLAVRFLVLSKKSEACENAYLDSIVKNPDRYLKDNVISDVEDALQKLINLRIKPQNAIEWLAFELLNAQKTSKTKRTQDHFGKPIGDQLDFKLLGTCSVFEQTIYTSKPSGASRAEQVTIGVKRKLPTDGS